MNPNKVIISVLIALVVILLGYFILKGGNTANTPANSEIIYTDLTSTEISKIPVGFPLNIPVEEQNIKESYKTNYFEEGVTQYTVAFNTSLTKEEVWKMYSDTFTASGYATNEENMNEEKGVLTGYRSGNKLNIAITPYAEGRYVTINYIERQRSAE